MRWTRRRPWAHQDRSVKTELGVLTSMRLSWGHMRHKPVALAAAVLVALGLFAYFASVTVSFPGEAGVSRWVQSWRSPWLDTLMEVISVPGVLAVAGPIVLLAAATLYVKGWREESILLLVTSVAGRLITMALKEMVGRARPAGDVAQSLQEVSGYAFPSGHVMHHTVFLGALLAVVTMRVGSRVTKSLALAIVLLTLAAIGLSRIYLGAHLLGDVVGGYVFGAATVWCAMWLWRLWSKRGPGRRAMGTKGESIRIQ